MDNIGKEFMEQTKYRNMQPSHQAAKAQPPLETPIPADARRIALPKPECAQLAETSLPVLINSRRSTRAYRQQALTMEELSFLLWCTQGVQQATDKYTLRTVPSAGARHAFETYLLINSVESLKPGLYRYCALDHALVCVVESAGIGEKLTAACLKQSTVSASAVTFFWAAELDRMYFRYGERGYRYLHLDAGHVCQNLYLAAEAIGCGACAIAAFDDDKVNAAIGLDGESSFVVYVAPVGKKL